MELYIPRSFIVFRVVEFWWRYERRLRRNRSSLITTNWIQHPRRKHVSPLARISPMDCDTALPFSVVSCENIKWRATEVTKRGSRSCKFHYDSSSCFASLHHRKSYLWTFTQLAHYNYWLLRSIKNMLNLIEYSSPEQPNYVYVCVCGARRKLNLLFKSNVRPPPILILTPGGFLSDMSHVPVGLHTGWAAIAIINGMQSYIM